MRLVGIYVNETYLDISKKQEYPVISIGKEKYEFSNDTLEELTCIIERLYDLNLITKKELEALLKISKIYDTEKILELMIDTRYNVTTGKMKDKAEEFSRIFDVAVENFGSFIDNTYYTQFFYLSLGYECNYCLSRIGKPYIFDTKDFLELAIDELDYETDAKNLLIGQIYSDLLHKTEQAKKYYSQSDTAFGWYKLGDIFFDADKNAESAQLCYENALKKNPHYYKAIFGYAQTIALRWASGRERDREITEWLESVVSEPMSGDVIRATDVNYKYMAYIQLISLYYHNSWYGAMERCYDEALSIYNNASEEKKLEAWVNSVDINSFIEERDKRLKNVKGYQRLQDIYYQEKNQQMDCFQKRKE